MIIDLLLLNGFSVFVFAATFMKYAPDDKLCVLKLTISPEDAVVRSISVPMLFARI